MAPKDRARNGAVRSKNRAENGTSGISGTSGTSETHSKRDKIVVWEYPPLPKWETRLNWAVTVGIFVAIYYYLFQLSSNYNWRRGGYTWSWLPYFGWRKRDKSNSEWESLVPKLKEILPFLCIHSLLFNLTEHVFGPTRKFAWEAFTLVYSMVLLSWPLYAVSVISSMVSGVFIFATAYHTRSTLATWIVTVSLLYVAYYNELLGIHEKEFEFEFSLLLSYTAVSYVSYSLEFMEGKSRPEDDTFWKKVFRMWYYALYLPYSIVVIVTYPEFEEQLKQRQNKLREVKNVLFFAFRLILWYCVLELSLHFFCFEAVLDDKVALATIPKPQLATLGYAMGQFFHMKYIVIFGIFSLFARVDNMDPPAGPICVSHVSLYSKIWRNFDRGLYQVFKRYIFVPICRPTFSLWRKAAAVFLCYGFVLVWHGFSRAHYVWITMNIAEILTEQLSKTFYCIPKVREWREAHISDTNFRRILAWLQVFPYALGLYSNFYFLAGRKGGEAFTTRILWGETFPLRLGGVVLSSMGYFFNQSVMEVERWQSAREQKKLQDDWKKGM